MPVRDISSEKSFGPLVGSSGPWNIDYDILVSSHVKGLLDGVDVTASLVVTLNTAPTPGAIVTSLAPLTGTQLVIYRDVPVRRTDVDYQESGDFRAETADFDQDWQTMCLQQLRDTLARALVFAKGSTSDAIVPEPSAGDVLGWDALGNLVNVDISLFYPGALTVTAFSQTLLARATAALWRGDLSVPSITEALLLSVFTTKGDIVVRNNAGAVVRVPVGADNQVMTADSTQANGIKWAAAPSVQSPVGAIVAGAQTL